MDTRIPESARSSEGAEADRFPALGVHQRREVSGVPRLRAVAGCNAGEPYEAARHDHRRRQAGRSSSMKFTLALLFLFAPVALMAQQPPADTTKPVSPPPAQAPATVSIPVDFSGVLY